MDEQQMFKELPDIDQAKANGLEVFQEKVVDALTESTNEVARTLNNSTAKQAQDQIGDLELWGDGDTWRLICKASSKKEGWYKSTKALQLPQGVLVQVTTREENGIAEALQYVPGVKIREEKDSSGTVIRRYFK